jgi:hypothetical protein
MVITSMGVFLQRSIYRRKAVANSYVVMLGMTPYKLFLKVPWANNRLASSDFTFRTRKKAAGVKIDEQGGCEVILIPFAPGRR